MATRKGEIIGTANLIDRLMTPRIFTRFALVGVFACLSAIFWSFLDYKILVYISNSTTPLCIMCTVAVWSMRDKVDAVLDGEHLTPSSFLRAKRMAGSLRSRSMRLAARLTFMTFLVSSAGISSATFDAIYQWMVILGGIGVGECIYGYLLANSWEEQLRAERDALTLDQKRRDEQERLISRIESSAKSNVFKAGAPAPSTGASLGKDVH